MPNSTPVDVFVARGRRAALVSAALAAIALLCVMSVAGNAHSGEATLGHAHVTPAPSAPPTPPVPTVAAAKVQPDLVLPQPTAFLDGVPTGYPQTPAGAIAAAYGYSRLATGVDVPLTLHTIEAMADPTAGWFPRQRAQIADGLVEQRATLGLPATGSPGGAGITVNPSAYKVESGSGPNLTVLTLNVIDAQNNDGSTTSGTVVFRWVLRWNGSRWLATAGFLDDRDAPSAVAPYTSAAAANGWQVASGG